MSRVRTSPAEEQPLAADRLIAVALMGLSFAVSAMLVFRLFDSRAIVQLDVWFQADPDDYLVYRFRDLLRHPNIELFLGIPLTALRKALAVLGIGSADPMWTAKWLMLLAGPTASAVRTLAAYRALDQFTGRRWLAVLLSLLDMAAFSSVAFGAPPESFALTAAALAVLYYLLIGDSHRDRVRWTAWIVTGTFAAGVTLSNLAPFAILFGTLCLIRGARLPRAAALTATAVVAVIGLTAALAIGTAIGTGQPLSERIDTSTGRFVRSVPRRDDISEVVLAMAHTFVAPRAELVPGQEPPVNNPDYDFQMLLPTTVPSDPIGVSRGLFTALILGLGAAGFLRRRQTAFWMLPASAVIVSNFVLHLFYGHHYFLYSPHWEFSMIWIMAGVSFLPDRVRPTAIALLVVFVATTAVNSYLVASHLLAFLRAA
jgi:hypothetical protein